MAAMLSGHADHQRDSLVEVVSEDHAERFVYCNPCLGIPPIVIDSPRHFLSGHLLMILVSMAALLLIEWSR